MLLLLSCISAVFAAPFDDLIEELPGYGAPPTIQYSGFLDASAGVDGTHLHYWFATCEKKDCPVVLWLNGGPGSSSLLGFMQEVGPLLINEEGNLLLNPYSWTKLAHVLVIESPAGVGYSYCKESLQGKPCINTDKNTAAAARAAVVDFFGKFPELSKSKFYVTGESYAGVYVPTLVKEILDNAPSVNMAGLAVGDPCTDNDSQEDSMDMIWYAHKNGFLDDDHFDFLWTNCSYRHSMPITKGKVVINKGTFNTDEPVALYPQAACTLSYRKYLTASSRGFSQGWENGYINDLSLFGPFAVVPFTSPGSLNYAQAQYMMRDDVKKVLHVTQSPNPQWPGPGDGWVYNKQWAACNGDAPAGTPSMIDFYRNIAPRLETTNVFNGDTDPCVSYEGTRTAIGRVGYPKLAGGSFRPWFFNMTKTTPAFLATKPLLYGPDLSLRDAGFQFGGEVISYAHNLSFITIHGSGHMVPQFRPQAAFHMISKVLAGVPLSPLLESDAAVAAMDQAEFDTYLDKWTVAAKAAPYSSTA